jgi:hypothetical protein
MSLIADDSSGYRQKWGPINLEQTIESRCAGVAVGRLAANQKAAHNAHAHHTHASSWCGVGALERVTGVCSWCCAPDLLAILE